MLKPHGRLLERYGLPLDPCLPKLHAKFRDSRYTLEPLTVEITVFRFVGSTNYEELMSYLEKRRQERQSRGPEELPGQLWSPDQLIPQYRTQVVRREQQQLLFLALVCSPAATQSSPQTCS